VVAPSGEAMSEAVPGLPGQGLISPQLVPYAPLPTLEEAQEKARREASRLVNKVEKSCLDARINWKEASD
jgi:hypothetical protein